MLNDPHLEQKPSPWFIYLHEYCQFLQTEKRYSTHTISAIQRDVTNIQHLPWPPTPAMLKAVLVAATTAGKAPKTLARWASSWRGLFRFAVHQGYLNSNPAEALRTPKPQQSLPKAVAIDPLMALMSAPLPTATPGSAQHWQLQAQVLMQLLYGTGMRLSEALSLRCPSHLGRLAHQQGNPQDKHLGVLNVQEGSVRIQGKGNKIRTVPLLGVVVQGLQTLLQLRAEYLALKAKPITAKPIAAQTKPSQSLDPTHGHDMLFISRKGQALHPRQAQKDIAQCAAQLGLPQHLHPHMLRHSFGSHMLQSTQNLRAVQELLGHASIRSTQVYTALDFAHLSAVYDKAFPRAK